MDDTKISGAGTWGGYRRSLTPSATHDCYYQCASDDPAVDQIWAYTDAISYGAGEVIGLHVNTTAEVYSVEIYRDGINKGVVYQSDDLEGRFSPPPADCSVNGCNWPLSLEIPVGDHWVSGGYIVRLAATATDGTPLIYEHVFIRRPGPQTEAGRLLLVAATGTWCAYNDWGGSNHYEGITGPHKDQFSPTVSVQRPWARGFVSLPAGAPRIPLRERPKMGAMIRYPHMEWARANGFSKKYASAGWASYEGPYLHWLERSGYAVDMIAGQDLQFHPELLDGYECITIVGHDEYWSWEMRDAVDAYVAAGGNVARFAGNFFWQTRLEDGGNTQICYKSTAEAADPVVGTDAATRITTCWDSPAIGRPGAETFGLSGARGVYAGWGGCVPRGAGGFTVYRPEHWVFAGCDVYYGDVLGSEARVFGYEVDGVDHIVRDGLPFATGSDGAPETLEILALGLSTVFEADHGNGNGTELFIGSADAEFHAKSVYGAATPEAIDRYKRGSGMIAIFPQGDGWVFNAGSCEWVNGLIERDPQVEGVTRNVLERFLGG